MPLMMEASNLRNVRQAFQLQRTHIDMTLCFHLSFLLTTSPHLEVNRVTHSSGVIHTRPAHGAGGVRGKYPESQLDDAESCDEAPSDRS